MTAYEFKEAMKTDDMKFEFAAFLNERNVETAEALIQAMADFAIAKGCDIAAEQKKSEKVGALTDDDLGNVTGGKWENDGSMNLWRDAIQNYYPPFSDISKLVGTGMNAIFGNMKNGL